MPPIVVGVLRRHPRDARKSERKADRVQALRAVAVSVLVLARGMMARRTNDFVIPSAAEREESGRRRARSPLPDSSLRLGMTRSLSLAVAFLAICASASAATKSIDILITGGTVLTMAGPNIANGSVAIDNGRIVAVGPSSEIDKSYTAKTTIRAGGMAVLPGFVNTHTHAAMTLFRGIADDRDLMDWLTHFIFPAEAKNVSPDFVKWGTRLAAAEMIQSGTTTFADMYYFESDVAREVKAAGLRGVLGE